MTQDFIAYARQYVPKFKIVFKDKSPFMKFLSVLFFFNKNFMDGYIATIGYTIYMPTETEYLEHQEGYLEVLTHEFVHMMDYKKYNLLFPLSYLFPQLLVIFSLFSLMAIHYSHAWLFCLLFLVFIMPFPAYFRMYWELRGCVMNAAFNYWRYGFQPEVTDYLDRFTDLGYYFMWPFKTNTKNRLRVALDKIKDNSILADKPYRVVSDFLKK